MAGKRHLWLAVLAAVAGCASAPVRSGDIEVRIEPATVHPGDVVRVEVSAPPETVRVHGRLDVPGSPVLPLRRSGEDPTWTLTTQIPLSTVWEPGVYRAVVTAELADGTIRTGEAWITAP